MRFFKWIEQKYNMSDDAYTALTTAQQEVLFMTYDKDMEKLEMKGKNMEPQLDEKDDHVVKPDHYVKFKIEPITFIMQNNLCFEIGNIVKYAVRSGSKTYDGMTKLESEITDLKKVRRYAEMRINLLEGKDIL